MAGKSTSGGRIEGMHQLKPYLHRIITVGRRALPLLLSRRALIAAVAFWVPVIVFVGLADEVGDGDTLHYDQAVLQFINANIATPELDPFVVALSNIGGLLGVATITTGVVLLLLARGYRRWAAYVTAVIGGTAVVNSLLKLLFARDRPSLFDTIVTETSYSFPSGHAMMSAAMAFTAIVLAWHTRYRLPVTIAAVVYFLAVSFTRLYLGVHYPTDLIAGWCIAAAWVVVMYFALRMNRRKTATIKTTAPE